MNCKSNSSENMGGGVACVYELGVSLGQPSSRAIMKQEKTMK